MRGGKNIKQAGELGKKFASKLKELKVETGVFDRSGYKFHGALKAFVENIRQAGIKI